MPEALNKSYPLENGVYRVLEERPRVPLGQASNFLHATAAVYEPFWRGRSIGLISGGSFSTERELELMLAWLSPTPDSRILDAACSAGLYARTLLKRDPSLDVHAVDYSLPFLKKAKQYAERDAVSPTLVLADVSELPYKDNSFGGLVCGGSLNEFLDVPKVLGEFARVLQPGSRMWQMYAAQAKSPFGKLVQGTLGLSGIEFIDPEILETQAEAAGFILKRAQYRGGVGMALFELET